MEKIKIRKIRLEDLDDFYANFTTWVSSQFPEYNEKMINFLLTNKNAYTKENYGKKIKKRIRFLIGAFVDNKIAGILDAALPYLGVSTCTWLVVDPEMQKKGIGTKLINAWAKDMLKAGAHSLHLDAPKRNIDYYKEHGFIHIGEFKKAWFGVDTNYLTKQIQEPKEENYLK